MIKKLVFGFFALAVFKLSYSQSDIEKTYFAQDFKDTFKNSSIVIKKYFKEFTYTKAGINDYKINVVIRVQYSLNDISALSAFNMLSKKSDLKRYELKQIKANGKVNTIYEYYDKKYPDDGYDPAEKDSKKSKDENLPLEDLEIGDIIDYKIEYTYTTKIKDPRSVLASNGKIDEEYVKMPNHNQYRSLPFSDEYLVENYDLVSKLTVLVLPSDLKLIQRSFNTDFRFKETKSSEDTRYECLATLLPAYESIDFSYGMKYYPVLRYAIIQTNATKRPFYPYQFESESVNQDQIVALGRKLFRDKNYISHILAYKKVSNLKEYQYSQNDIYQDLTYSKFFKAFDNTFCKKDKNKLESLNKFHDYLSNDDKLNDLVFSDMDFAVLLGRYCDYKGIKYEMMACLPRYEGEWKEVLSPYNITWGIFIPNPSGDLYIAEYGEKSNIYEKTGALANTEIILFNTLKDIPFRVSQYPSIKPEDNLYEIETIAKISDDKIFDYDITNSYLFTGYLKYNINDNISNQFNIKSLRTAGFYGFVNIENVYGSGSFKTYFEYFEEMHRVDSSWNLYLKDYHQNQMKLYLYNEYKYDLIELDSLNINNDEEFEDNDSSVYRFKNYFKADGLLDDTESDSLKIINLGTLITSQYHLDNYKADERKNDIYSSNLRKINYNFTVELPAGFKPVNLEDFNFNFDNEAGQFKSVATLENGKIVLHVFKIYKFNYLPKEKWPLVIEFLQTAEKYFQKKLIIVK